MRRILALLSGALTVAALLPAGQVAAGATPPTATPPTTTSSIAAPSTSTDLIVGPDPVTVELPHLPQTAFVVGEQPVEIDVRTRTSDGWGAWSHLDVPGDAEAAFLWLGRDTDAIEFRADTPTAVRLQTRQVEEITDEIRPMALLDTGTGGPAIRSRSDWADSGRTWDWSNPDCDDGPETWPTIEATVIHHTGSGTAYLPETVDDVIASIRGIYDSHVESNGWCDIGYNFVVDASGTMWEARTGGHDLAVQGAHVSGFNWITSGILALGSFSDSESTPTTPMLNSLGDLAAWKLRVHGKPTSGPVFLKEYSDLATYPVSLYTTFIGSAPSPTEENALRTAISQRGRYDAALELAQSDAWAGVMVDGLYQDALGRSADDDGRAYWVGQLRSGLRVETAAIYFYGSEEYYERSGGPTPYVTSLYQQLLGRAPDPSGLQFWSGLLSSGSSDPAGIVSGFYASIESRLNRVRDLYQRILLRNPDADGHTYWAGQLLRIDDIVLAAFLASSDEFHGRSAREVATERVTYHGLLNPTACPGTNMIAVIPTIRQRAATA
ncbi:MAG: DUF4214 domain-containing protein [Actinobacteria bacterium]|nr:DUF4214 domain-containing protein [Actinomycetota bacterium]